ncbi:hypothetical protein [Pedobacter punctiformis]|uniref:Uncharacterized protein n=1 Tax=Pedobacter punctiformis TaxID=3004097 RepID=A0ABT4L757_9SPHI|nr:hypothetical protein [Pedobacter sp. HCMS5-2]MCZ4243754.1 hypothetical protein [Pedobacter sp. HCMS5-2]
MKTSLFILVFLAFGKITYGQQLKQSIDYQFHREGKNYYAFELFKDAKDLNNNQLMLNFISSANFKKVDKILIKAGEVEVKLKFKLREEKVNSDNPEQRFYPIVFDLKSLTDKKMECNAQIIFKLDDGSSLTLPFTTCSIKELVVKN